MRKRLINEKRAELKQLPRPELVERILSYPDQDSLNMEGEGRERKQRQFPIGKMAEQIQSHGYGMSDKQYYTLIHYFSQIAVQDLKIVGVTFYNNDPADFKKEPVSAEGTKSVFQATFTLRPEPENPHDKNAVMVLVDTKSEGLHQVGYLSRDFVAKHPISEVLEVPGTITDFSNGKFKNVSYGVTLDMEQIGKLSQSQGIGIDAGKNVRLYDYVFTYKSDEPDIERLNACSNSVRDWAEALNGTLERAEHHNCRKSHAESLEWEFKEGGAGVVHVGLSGEPGKSPSDFEVVADFLSEKGYHQEQRYAYDRYVPYYEPAYKVVEDELHERGISMHMDLNPYTVQILPVNHLAVESMEPYHGPELTRIYERVFSCNGAVPDPGRAASYINSLNLGEQLDGDFETYGVPCHVEKLEWSFNKDGTGTVHMELTGIDFNGPVTATSVANGFVKYQHDGPLASRMREEGLVDVRFNENVFNKKNNGGFLLKEKAAIKMAELKEKAASRLAPDMAGQKPKQPPDGLMLTETDLGFAKQMDLSDFGLY